MGPVLNEGEGWGRESRTDLAGFGGGWPSLRGCGRRRGGLCGWDAGDEGVSRLIMYCLLRMK